MNTTIYVIGQELRVKDGEIIHYAPGSTNFVRFQFVSKSDWEDLTVCAKFIQNEQEYDVYLEGDNTAFLPTQIQPGICNLVLYGTNGNGLIATTNALELIVDYNGLIEDIQTVDITPTLYEQLVRQIQHTQSLVGSPLVASAMSDMTDENKIYVYVGEGAENGHWFYYDGTEWTDGGVYQSSSVSTDDSLQVEGAAADSKAAGDAIDALRAEAVPYPVYPDPKYGNAGQLLRTNGDGTTEWVNYALPTDAQTEQAVSDWLDDHPEAVTTVEDGSITAEKFSPELELKAIKEYYTPEMFGAVGDYSTDDKAAIELMLASVPNNAHCVFYKNYYISDGITITRPVNITMYGTMKVAPTASFCVRVDGHDVRRNKFRLNLTTSSTEDQWRGVYNTIGLDCYGAWENEFDVNLSAFSVGIRMISPHRSGGDCTYNKIFIRYIYNCKTAILITGEEGSVYQVATGQNTFIGGRIGAQSTAYAWLDPDDTSDYYAPLKSVLVGGRTNNNNNFLSVSFEGFGVQGSPYQNRARIYADMLYSAMIGCRYEGVTGFYSRSTCAVISGFGFDSIPNVTGEHTAVGTYEGRISTYTKPVILKRTGNTGTYLSVRDYDDRQVFFVNADRMAEVKGISISAPNETLESDARRTKIIGATSNPVGYTPGTGEFAIGNAGYLKHKNLAGTVYTYMPIKTTKPSAASLLVTGMMVFSGGRPQWWDGSKWVYADGTTAT